MKNCLLTLCFSFLSLFAYAQVDEQVRYFEELQSIAQNQYGSASARFELGLMYLKGNGTSKDEKKAFEWIKKVQKKVTFGHSLI